MVWCLVRFSTETLRYLYTSPLEVALQSAVASSEAKDGGLLMSWQLMERVRVWVVSSSLASASMAGGPYTASWPSHTCDLGCFNGILEGTLRGR